ncbi:uncharacterized protein J4E79_003149 [Alternaria viburni]|uniref:uncharacterized protein n=1 Tax=Alternaria viburni TaxID=566460 RepID=UPI0020C2F9EB|nr:uncharacterized protein J4E79_003149 [Alternaria viburni]KAI4664851.1 hypothetical protein J4E79_003149 [Alternaria viburni]
MPLTTASFHSLLAHSTQVLSAAASRARNAPLTGALSELPSQLPEPPPGHQTARTRSSTTKAKRPPAFTVFTDNTGATEQILDDADPTTSIIDECTVPDIVDRCSLTDNDLFSELTADEIRSLVERLLPDLQEDGVQEFLATVYDHACTSPPFVIPRRERDPSTWPLTYPDMDFAWGQAVEGEHAIELPDTMDNWIDMSESNLVKPTGSLRDTLLIVSSYPTARVGSTVHRSYGTTMDMFNVSLFMLYAKLGHNVSSIRHHGALHLNLYPRRINRKLVPTGQGVLEKLPAQLREYWTSFAHELEDKSQSKLALLVSPQALPPYNATGKRFITE